MLPEWLVTREEVPLPPPKGGRYRRGVLGKTIADMAALIEHTLFLEKYAARAGLMQGLGSRTKILFMVALVLSASLARQTRTLLLLYAFLLVFALASRIPFSFFLIRVWFFIPLFSAFVIAPATLNVITPGDALVHISQNLYVTRQGVSVAIFFTLRVAVSVSTVVLVQLSTKWHDLLAGLSSLRVPTLFILTLEMCFRYIMLLSHTVTDLHLAKKSRTIASSSAAAERRWVGGSMAFILKKSLALSENVYFAMVSRGFSGQVKSPTRPRFALRDYAFLAGILIVCVMLLLLERVGA